MFNCFMEHWYTVLYVYTPVREHSVIILELVIRAIVNFASTKALIQTSRIYAVHRLYPAAYQFPSARLLF